MKPTCGHPDRRHAARGMCRPCYSKAWESKTLQNIRYSERHGDAGPHYNHRTPEYKAWEAMKYRCHVPTAQCFHLYGGRGIRVCDKWRESFSAFLADVGRRPSAKHSLDRINNDGHYEPGNVRWATWRQQHTNTRRSRTLTWNGITHPIPEWADRTGIHRNLIYKRLQQGWSIDRTLTEPPQERHYPSPPSIANSAC